jgi:hypothetical protein
MNAVLTSHPTREVRHASSSGTDAGRGLLVRGRVQQPPEAQVPPAISATELFDAPRRTRQRMDIRGMLPSLLINAAAPLIGYQILTGNGMPTAQALTASAVFPVIGIGWSIARTRRADIIGLVSLAFIVAGVAASAISGDTRFILIKESMLTGVFGIICLASLWLPRPLMFYFGRQFTSAGDPARAAVFESLWQYPQFRAVTRTMTLVWGGGYLCEAAVRIALSFALPIPVFLIASRVLSIAVTIALISWTLAYARRSAPRGADRLAAMPGIAPVG